MAILSEAMTSTKTGWVAVVITYISNWWVDWGSVAADIVATILGITLTLILIVINWRALNKPDKKDPP